MRVLLSAVGTRGDVQPVLALASEIRLHGHDVRLCVPPNFVASSAELGFEATPVGIAMRAPAGSAPVTPPTPDQLRKLGEDLIQSQFDAVGAAAEGCDRIVAAGAHQYAARTIAEVRGVPCVSAVYAPISVPSPDHAPPPAPGQPWERGEPAENLGRWRENLAAWNARALDRVNTNRVRLGLPPVDDVLGHILGDRPWLAADPVLGPAPVTPGREIVQTGAWILPDPTPLPPELEAFLAAGEPPICFGFGSMPVPQDVSRTLIEAARALGRRAIVAQGWAELGLVDDAPDCLSIGDVNQQTLFPRVAAVVHHGGAGTTTAAARAGVPQVLVPMFGDQFYWASRVGELGIGASVARSLLTAETLAAALDRALASDVAARARSLATEIVPDGAAIAAERILTLPR